MKRFPHIFLTFSVLVFLGACTTTDITSMRQDAPRVGPIAPSGEEPAPVESSGKRLIPGERIEIFVKEDPSFDGIYPVRKGGDIIIPKVGRINVDRMTPSEAEAKIKSTLEVSQLNTATVIVDHLASTKPAAARTQTEDHHLNLYFTGLVNQPGPHRIPQRATSTIGAYESLLISGGISRFADERKSYILRLQEDGSREKLHLNLEAIKLGNQADVAVQDHDILVVPERIFGF